MSADGKTSAKLSPPFSRGPNAAVSNRVTSHMEKILRCPVVNYITILHSHRHSRLWIMSLTQSIRKQF